MNRYDVFCFLCGLVNLGCAAWFLRASKVEHATPRVLAELKAAQQKAALYEQRANELVRDCHRAGVMDTVIAHRLSRPAPRNRGGLVS